jgi:hypothetical protein
LVFAAFGPPVSQWRGIDSWPLICFAQPSFRARDVLHLLGERANILEFALAWLEVHFASGIASANDVKSISICFHM